jgi:Phage protein Gp138 N-terminal domain
MPSLAKVITDAIEARLASLHTLLPGRVVKVDLARGRADVEPLLMRLNSDGVAVALPIITDCPIAFYRAGKAAVYLPLAVGDQVEIRFSERSLDTWLSKGGVVDPADGRKHHLSDAVVYPGLYDGTKPPVGTDASSLILVHDQAKVSLKADGEIRLSNAEGTARLTPAGNFTFTGAGGGELLQILSDLMKALTEARVATMLGPQPFLPVDALKINELKAKIDELKG